MSLNDSLSVPSGPLSIDKLLFTSWDYVMFALLLVFSCAIGLYYGFFAKRKQNTTEQYMLGGKKMNIFAVSASLIASHVSATGLLGVPSDIYAYGTQYWMIGIPVLGMALSLLYIYLPVFHDMQVASSFQYLEKRYNRKIRVLASLVYLTQCITYTPIVIYGPSIAFAQVTGIHEHIIGPLICVICIFYTTIGGLKAVVWTDFLQFVIMVASIVAVIFLGIDRAGGWANVWRTADEGGRLIFFE